MIEMLQNIFDQVCKCKQLEGNDAPMCNWVDLNCGQCDQCPCDQWQTLYSSNTFTRIYQCVKISIKYPTKYMQMKMVGGGNDVAMCNCANFPASLQFHRVQLHIICADKGNTTTPTTTFTRSRSRTQIQKIKRKIGPVVKSI